MQTVIVAVVAAATAVSGASVSAPMRLRGGAPKAKPATRADWIKKAESMKVADGTSFAAYLTVLPVLPLGHRRDLVLVRFACLVVTDRNHVHAMRECAVLRTGDFLLGGIRSFGLAVAKQQEAADKAKKTKKK